MELFSIRIQRTFQLVSTSQDVQQVQEQLPVVNPEEERLACFPDRSGKRHGLPVHGILEEVAIC